MKHPAEGPSTHVAASQSAARPAATGLPPSGARARVVVKTLAAAAFGRGRPRRAVAHEACRRGASTHVATSQPNSGRHDASWVQRCWARTTRRTARGRRRAGGGWCGRARRRRRGAPSRCSKSRSSRAAAGSLCRRRPSGRARMAPADAVVLVVGMFKLVRIEVGAPIIDGRRARARVALLVVVKRTAASRAARLRRGGGADRRGEPQLRACCPR